VAEAAQEAAQPLMLAADQTMYPKLRGASIIQPQAASLLLHLNTEAELPDKHTPSHNA
jgi:hypothetical protein